MNKLVVVGPKSARSNLLRSLQDELGHWDIKATQKLVADGFWWPNILREVAYYVKICEAFQKMKGPKAYKNSLFDPQNSLLDVFLLISRVHRR